MNIYVWCVVEYHDLRIIMQNNASMEWAKPQPS